MLLQVKTLNTYKVKLDWIMYCHFQKFKQFFAIVLTSSQHSQLRRILFSLLKNDRDRFWGCESVSTGKDKDRSRGFNTTLATCLKRLFTLSALLALHSTYLTTSIQSISLSSASALLTQPGRFWSDLVPTTRIGTSCSVRSSRICSRIQRASSKDFVS